MARRFLSRRSITTEVEAAPRERLTHRIIEEALQICEQRGWPVLAITTQGYRWEYEGEQLQRLRSVFSDYGVRVIEMPTKRERPDLYYTVDPHWDATGHAWVADLVYQRLLADPRFDLAAEGP